MKQEREEKEAEREGGRKGWRGRERGEGRGGRRLIGVLLECAGGCGATRQCLLYETEEEMGLLFQAAANRQ